MCLLLSDSVTSHYLKCLFCDSWCRYNFLVLIQNFPTSCLKNIFLQDGNGGIWLIDCNVYVAQEKGQRLVKCHAGDVMDLAVSPSKHFFVTLGIGGRFLVYNYLKRKIVFEHKFPARGCCLLWLPITVIQIQIYRIVWTDKSCWNDHCNDYLIGLNIFNF